MKNVITNTYHVRQQDESKTSFWKFVSVHYIAHLFPILYW